MDAIDAQGLTKAHDSRTAVVRVDLEVEAGEIVALLGPNGAGKTTTMMMLLGIVEPDAGNVRLLGHHLPAQRGAALARANFTASYVSLPDRIRVREALEVFRCLYGADRRRLSEVVEAFGVGPLLDRFTYELSSGQRTLVGLAKSLVNRPELLFLDEPTASLDPEVAHRVRTRILELHGEEGFAVLITSHNMAEVERLCRRVVFLAGGRVVADDAPAGIAARYRTEDLEAAFRTIAAGDIP